jgi:hypothetical protein
VLQRAADVALLVAMAYMPTGSRAAGHALVAAHLLRSSFANASRPLLRSVLMDNGAPLQRCCCGLDVTCVQAGRAPPVRPRRSAAQRNMHSGNLVPACIEAAHWCKRVRALCSCEASGM